MILLCLAGLQAQGAAPDLNNYYRSTLSIGAQFQYLLPFGEYRTAFDVSDLGLQVRYPWPTLPALQPGIQVGLQQFIATTTDKQWEHRDVYGLLGLSYAERLSKALEIGGELGAGFSYALFPNLLPDTPLMANGNFLAKVSGRLDLIPAFNFALELVPSLTWTKSLGQLTDFDGFSFGIGVSVHLRLGDDPDAPHAALKYLHLDQALVPPTFAAMQGYYSKNPIGKAIISNTASSAITDIEVAFYQKGYMDAPTPSFTAASLAAGGSLEVPLMALFSAEVFKFSGGFKPLNGEIIVDYKLAGRSAEQRFSVGYDLYEKTAMTWDDDRKAAAFITPLDSALQNYAAFIGETGKSARIDGYSKVVQDVMLTWSALREIGLFFQDDPNASFTRVKEDPSVVDYISMPRLTLKRRYGDCKNLTVLFNSLLETRGVHSGFVTVPGHIFPIFDTGLPASAWRDISPDRGMTIVQGGTLWVPVEATMLDDTSDFQTAWKTAIGEWEANPASRAFYRTADAQAVFPSVAVEDQDLGLQYGLPDGIRKRFANDLNQAVTVVFSAYQATAEASNSKQDFNRLGINAAGLGKLVEAEAAFTRALKLDPGFVAAGFNLANAILLRADYPRAVKAYKQVLGQLGDPAAGSGNASLKFKVLGNLARTYTALKDDKAASAALAEAAKIDPAKTVTAELAP